MSFHYRLRHINAYLWIAIIGVQISMAITQGDESGLVFKLCSGVAQEIDTSNHLNSEDCVLCYQAIDNRSTTSDRFTSLLATTHFAVSRNSDQPTRQIVVLPPPRASPA